MPDPKDSAKGTGDVHPPEVEERRPSAEDLDELQRDEARPGRGENQAGFLKEDAKPSGGSATR